jgi:hypothetical protein
MTDAQEKLKQYLFAKMAEGSIGDFTAPKDMAVKIVLEVLSDAEVAFGDFVAHPLKQVLFTTLGGVARDMSKRGVFNVLREYGQKAAKAKETLDMQYQRGVERNRTRKT